MVDINEHIRFLILACDGLWDVIDSQKAVDFIEDCLSQGLSAQVSLLSRRFSLSFSFFMQDSSDAIAKLALRYGSSDNISVIVVLLSPIDE